MIYKPASTNRGGQTLKNWVPPRIAARDRQPVLASVKCVTGAPVLFTGFTHRAEHLWPRHRLTTMTPTFARFQSLVRFARILPAAALALLITGCAVVPGDPYYDPPRYPVMEQPGVIYGAPPPYYRSAPIYQNEPLYRAPQPVYVAPPPAFIFNGRLGYSDRRDDRRNDRNDDRRDNRQSNNGWRDRDHDKGRDNYRDHNRNRADNDRPTRTPDRPTPQQNPQRGDPVNRDRQDNDRRNYAQPREGTPSQTAPAPNRAEPRVRNDVNRSPNRQDQP